MKKITGLIAVFSMILAMGAWSAVVVQETFTYADGPVEGLNGGSGWAAAWDAGTTDGSTRRFNVLNNEAIYNGSGTGVTINEQNRGFGSAITVGASDTVTLVFDLIRPEGFAGRGIGIYLTHGGTNQFFVGKEVNDIVGLKSGIAVGSTDYAEFATSGTRETITMVVTYNGALTSMVLSDSDETLDAYTFPGQLVFDGISLAASHNSTLANGIDEISVDVVEGSSIAGAVVWTDAGVGSDTGTADNWLSTATGLPPTETPSAGLALVYDGGVVITNAAACNGNLDVGENALVIDGVIATMQTGDLAGTAVSITEATLEKGIASGAAIILNTNAVLRLSETLNPLDGATVDLNSLAASLELLNVDSADFMADHVGKVTAFGEALQLGSDPLVQEPGDTALVTEINGGLGVEVTAVTLNLNVDGTLLWTNDGQWYGTGDVSNWLSTATGTYPVENPDDGLALIYSGGVVITNTGSCNGDLFVGDNALVINGVANEMVTGSMSGSSTIDITDARLNKTFVSDAAVTLHADAVLKLTGGAIPVNGATIDLNSATAILQFNAETFTAFTNEHINKVTSFGVALEFGADPYVEEAGDNAVAADYNAPNGVSIRYSDGIPPEPAIPAHEGFDGILGESVNGTGSGNGWEDNLWLGFGGTAEATTFKTNNSFSDGTASVATSGLSAGLSGGEDLERSLSTGVTVGTDTNEYPEVWLSFLLDSSAGNAVGHEYRVTLASGGTDVVSFGKGVNLGWQLKTSTTNRTFTTSGGSVGNFLGVVKLAFDGTDTIITGYLAEDSDVGLDITDVSTFLLTDSITNSGNVVFDTVRMKSNNTTTTTIDEIRLAETYLDSIGLGGSPTEPIGSIAFSGPLGGGLGLSWDTTFGQVYNVETNANLMYSNWGVYDSLVGNGGGVTVTAAVDQATLFYKVTTP
jgi:hypothetical protein